MNKKEAIKKYQCTGCVNGSYPECYKQSNFGIGCSNHVPGTLMIGIGKLILGMPIGFNRVGSDDNFAVNIFENFENSYDKFNVATWKYLNNEGHTIVRGHRPRVNQTFIDVFLTNCIDKIDCIEITNDDIGGMN